MHQDYRDMIINNINKLLANKGWKQIDLSKNTNIPQPHLSKALNNNEKANFTLEQLIKIADVFEVSLDFLLGRSQLNPRNDIPSNEDIFKFFSLLLENNIISCKTQDIEEKAYIPTNTPDYFSYPYDESNLTNKYKIFYFSNYQHLLSSEEFEKLDETQQDNLITDAHLCGTFFPRNAELNNLFSYYDKLYDLKKNSDMDDEIYQTALQARLDKLEN